MIIHFQQEVIAIIPDHSRGVDLRLNRPGTGIRTSDGRKVGGPHQGAFDTSTLCREIACSAGRRPKSSAGPQDREIPRGPGPPVEHSRRSDPDG